MSANIGLVCMSWSNRNCDPITLKWAMLLFMSANVGLMCISAARRRYFRTPLI
jgi:hypothetical protein